MLGFHLILTISISSAMNKEDLFEAVADLRHCASLLKTDTLEDGHISLCKKLQTRSILIRGKRQLPTCTACQKATVFITKKHLERHMQKWKILSVNGKTMGPHDRIDIGDCKGHCRNEHNL